MAEVGPALPRAGEGIAVGSVTTIVYFPAEASVLDVEGTTTVLVPAWFTWMVTTPEATSELIVDGMRDTGA